MKRTQEKIKDIVEPQDFDEVRNVATDPARSLAAYRFTDATSDLLARWLDALADLPRGRGAARALAGARGVGKSHTLAVFGALAGQDTLRQKVEDAHVATSTRRLAGRRHTVVRVERGTRATLIEEMAVAFTKTFGGNEIQWGADPSEMLAIATSRVVDGTLVLVIDTGFDRPLRVRRDDGPQLAAIARATQGANAFVTLALDDDISSADGPNVAIVSAYQIDYLDHEHLFRIVDTYILRKSDQARAALHDIYLQLRKSVPGFNWSEPRFATLYPVHPLIADVAAAVRLYSPGFAFLPFASQAALRATSRPALSLILLDEVFDRAERDLRKSPELKEAFETYDDLATRAVSQIPVMQRLEAKLVLKSLFILSLDGGGATARSLCAALLVPDDETQPGGTARVGETLRRFAEVAPPGALSVSDETDDNGEARYRLQIGAADKFKTALERSIENFSANETTLLEHLRAAARQCFEDWPFAETQPDLPQSVNFSLAWRGSERRGRLTQQGASATDNKSAVGDYDVDVYVLTPDGAQTVEIAGSITDESRSSRPPLSVVWRPDKLAPEEWQILRRLHALRLDASLVTEFGDVARAALSTHIAQVARIWTRVYLNDCALEINGAGQAFGDHALAARTLAAALTETLAPHFERLFPQHPQFADTLKPSDVERAAATLFAAAGDNEEEAQRLARAFALPLGLVEERANRLVLVSTAEQQEPAWVQEILSAIVEGHAGGLTPIETIRAALRRAPYGLRPEAQNLVLLALVAQRRIELVGAAGERTSRRELDRPLRWDEIKGVAPARSSRLGEAEASEWVRRLTGRTGLVLTSAPETRETIRKALSDWLQRWGTLRLGDSFDALPGAALTTRAWKMRSSVQKHFGAAAAAVRSALEGEITFEEAVERVADAFRGDAERFESVARELEALTTLLENVDRRARARTYLLTAEPTGISEIEAARRELLAIAQDHESVFEPERNARFNRLWPEFHARYAEHYALTHDQSVGASTLRRALDRFLLGDRWREFEMLSRLKVVNRQYWAAAQELLRRGELARCEMPTRQLLVSHTSCACGFSLMRARALARLPRELEELIDLALAAYRRTLMLLGSQLKQVLEAVAAQEEGKRELAMHARLLATAFGGGTPPHRFSRIDIQLIERALAEMDAPAPVRVSSPTEDCGLLTREELDGRLRQWLDDLPTNAALVEVTQGSDSDAG